MLYYFVIVGVILLVVLALSILVHFLEKIQIRKKADRFFAGREPLTDYAFHSRYFREQKSHPDLTAKVRRILKEECNIDPRVVPHDRIDQVANVLNIDGMDLVELVMRLEEEFGISINDAEAGSCTTFVDIYDMVMRKVAIK
ncbi:MAG: acyl carrier protein [Pyrinomonadaceae bacterium]